MQITNAPFMPQHKWDRGFFLAFLAICWLGVIMGFTPAVMGRLHGKADYVAPLILHIHAAAFVGWMLLLSAQILLVSFKRVPVHKILGLTAFALIPVMAVSGIASEVYSQRFYFHQGHDHLNFFIIPIYFILAFIAFAGSALLMRRDPTAHKRLMLMATTVIVGAAYTRWWGDQIAETVGGGYFGTFIVTFTGTDLILLLALAYDLVTRKRLHAVYLIGVPLQIAGQLLVSYIYHSPAWLLIARKLIGY